LISVQVRQVRWCIVVLIGRVVFVGCLCLKGVVDMCDRSIHVDFFKETKRPSVCESCKTCPLCPAPRSCPNTRAHRTKEWMSVLEADALNTAHAKRMQTIASMSGKGHRKRKRVSLENHHDLNMIEPHLEEGKMENEFMAIEAQAGQLEQLNELEQSGQTEPHDAQSGESSHGMPQVRRVSGLVEEQAGQHPVEAQEGMQQAQNQVPVGGRKMSRVERNIKEKQLVKFWREGKPFNILLLILGLDGKREERRNQGLVDIPRGSVKDGKDKLSAGAETNWKRFWEEAIKGVAHLGCPHNPDLIGRLLPKINSSTKSIGDGDIHKLQFGHSDKLEKSIVDVVKYGSLADKRTALSILCQGLRFNHAKEVMAHHDCVLRRAPEGQEQHYLNQNTFANHRARYNEYLMKGMPIPPKKDKLHVRNIHKEDELLQ